MKRVSAGLRRMYGEPTSRRKGWRGLDVLVEAMLSQNTNMANARRGYAMLRRKFKTWPEVMAADVGDVQREIAICGLARMRAKRLQAMLRRISEERGTLSIEFLKKGTVEAGFEYLMGFHGIGPKTAAFTLLFGFGMGVLPVDNGVLRVVRRLAVVRRKARDLEAEKVLSQAIGEGEHLPMHVLMFRHAKERCRPKNPKCGECALLKLCLHGQRVIRHERVKEERARPIRLASIISGGLRKHGEDSAGRRRR